MRLVDSHCHLDQLEEMEKFGHIDESLKEAREAGVCHILSVGLTLNQSRKVIEIAKAHDDVSASVGIHPTESLEENFDVEKLTEELIQLGSDSKVVAIGETGLDFYREKEKAQHQYDKFRAHIRASKILKKPLIIHTRMACGDTLRIFQEEKASDIGGVMHCFTETWEMAKACLDLNFYISLSGIVTFKNATEIQALAKVIPLDRLLIETDAPYLAPVPYRGKTNKPSYVKFVAEKIAELRNENSEIIAEATTENYFRCFGLS